MTDTDPYREGFRARGAEQPINANPYPHLTNSRRLWRVGWTERDRHEADKGDALDSIGWNG